jgi:hypothetical protein
MCTQFHMHIRIKATQKFFIYLMDITQKQILYLHNIRLHYTFQQIKKKKSVNLCDWYGIECLYIPSISPWVMTLRKDKELQSTPL